MELTYEQIKAKQDGERLMHQWWTLQSETERQDTVRGISGCLEFGLTRNIARMPEAGKLAVELAYARHCKRVSELEAAHPAEPAPTRCNHVAGYCNCPHQETPWMPFKCYGQFYRISADGCLEYQPMMKDGTIAPYDEEDGPGIVDPMEAVEEPVRKVTAIIERLLRDPDAPENAAIKAFLAHPEDFEGERGDVLPEICGHCHIRFGNQCSHF